MSSNEPDNPAGGFEYPSLENAPNQLGPFAPVDYPADAGLPPPIYPTSPPGYAGAPGYYPYRPMRPPGVNGMAIASLVVSVVSIAFFCGLPSFIGVILGVMAMREIRRTGQDGRGLALAGTIIGGLATAAGLIIVLAYVALIVSGWQWI